MPPRSPIVSPRSPLILVGLAASAAVYSARTATMAEAPQATYYGSEVLYCVTEAIGNIHFSPNDPDYVDTASLVSEAHVAIWKFLRVDCKIWLDHAAADGTCDIDVARLNESDFKIIPDWSLVREKLLNDTDPKRGADWSFWVEWYDEILRGDPQDWELLYKIAVSDDIDWHASPREVNEAIARIVEKVRDPNLRKLKKKNSDLDAALELEKQKRAELQEQLENQKRETKEKFDGLEGKLDARFQSVVAEQAIEGPSELWKEKLGEHKTSMTEAYARFLKGLAMLAVLLSAIAYWLICGNADQLFLPYGCDLQFAPELCGGLSFRGTMVSVLCATLLTLGFWFIRVQLKVFLSERHLMIDARERMAFADAYVSLLRNKDNADGAAEQGLIVYNALFRPTSDGIIKEDGGLDPSLSAAISKFLAK